MAGRRLPLKLAVIGGGPSAFYVASRLLQLLPQNSALGDSLRIHIIDKLWAPHGLVRYGVAPDHPDVKNCTKKFDETGRDPRVRFFGNVNISGPSSSGSIGLNITKILPHYSHILLANGCPRPRLHPALLTSSSFVENPAEASSALSFCRPALDIVQWYTSHPAAPVPPDFSKVTHVTVIGHGNVALDVARILLSHPSRLAEYDVPKSVLDVLSQSRVRHVSIVGRRGPLQVGFAPRELREMMKLDDVSYIPLPRDILNSTEEELKTLENTSSSGGVVGVSRAQKRIWGILKEGSKTPYGATEKSFSIEFFKSPVGIKYDLSAISGNDGTGNAISLTLSQTRLDAPGLIARAIPTGETSIIKTNLVLGSLGYIPDSTFFTPGDLTISNPASDWLATPSQSHVRNAGGRILDSQGRIIQNAYVSGWAASGAKGVLARTVEDARMVAGAIIEDYIKLCEIQDVIGARIAGTPTGANDQVMGINLDPPSAANLSEDTTLELNTSSDLPLDTIPSEVQRNLEVGTVTTYEDWELVNAEEIRRGQSTVVASKGTDGDDIEVRKERERMDWQEARSFLHHIRAARM